MNNDTDNLDRFTLANDESENARNICVDALDLSPASAAMFRIQLQAAHRAADKLEENADLDSEALRDAIGKAREVAKLFGDVADRLEAAAETAARRLDDTTDTE